MHDDPPTVQRLPAGLVVRSGAYVRVSRASDYGPPLLRRMQGYEG